MSDRNIDDNVDDFGEEWTRFDQADLADSDLEKIFHEYFQLFPWHALPLNARGFDLGCGSGRCAKFVAPRIGQLFCIDPSEKALKVAKNILDEFPNCFLSRADVDNISLGDGSMDFGYSLGVLHHIPDTASGVRKCVAKLKRGAPVLLYLYYAFDNRPPWFRMIWKRSDGVRRIINRTPKTVRHLSCDLIALLVYLPAAFLARILATLGVAVNALPLSYYRDKPFYVMRNDALDRFGTRLEKRFTRDEMRTIMEEAGLTAITFSQEEPFWTALGYRAE